MLFWIITVAMGAAVAFLLARAMMRGAQMPVADAAGYDLQVYRDQLAEVERDVARGVISAEDAAQAKTEISRRILTADAAGRDVEDRGGPPQGMMIAALALALVGASVALYSMLGAPGYGDMSRADRIAFAEQMRENRPSQQAAEDSLPPGPEAPEAAAEFMELVERLRVAVAQRPDDAQGNILLAQTEARLGNFAAAARAQGALVRIRGTQVSAQELGDYAELLVLAAGGYVSPEAERVLRATLDLDETDGRARYYIGLMRIQTGRPDITFRIWDQLLRRGPPDAAWIAPIQQQIGQVAALAGVRYEIPAVGSGAPGPSQDDIDAAGDLSVAERMEMIGAMVEGLADRLASEGGPPTDWARLITSLGVLGEPAKARAVFDNAMQVFDGDAGALDIIRDAGSQAGVAE
ncbi:c-type cytochrome biogenesis protein CcmI [Sulfitobacter sp. JB4-11]|uniref:c-type cytochrome biogenesis protein CcmI n=1 Tax=Sulfitobacter rhodophyticola TaxID=3238304 RepID=UPI003D818FBF